MYIVQGCLSGLVLRFPISKAAVVVTSDQRFSEVVGDDRDGWIFSHSNLGGGGGEIVLCCLHQLNLVKCNKAIWASCKHNSTNMLPMSWK